MTVITKMNWIQTQDLPCGLEKKMHQFAVVSQKTESVSSKLDTFGNKDYLQFGHFILCPYCLADKGGFYDFWQIYGVAALLGGRDYGSICV